MSPNYPDYSLGSFRFGRLSSCQCQVNALYKPFSAGFLQEHPPIPMQPSQPIRESSLASTQLRLRRLLLTSASRFSLCQRPKYFLPTKTGNPVVFSPNFASRKNFWAVMYCEGPVLEAGRMLRRWAQCVIIGERPSSLPQSMGGRWW